MRSNDHFLWNMDIRIASEHSYLLVHHHHHQQQQHQYHPSSTVDISVSSSTVNVQETTGDQQLHDNYAHCIYSSPRGNFSAPHSNSNCRFSHLRKSFMCMYVCIRAQEKTSQHNLTFSSFFFFVLSSNSTTNTSRHPTTATTKERKMP